MVTNCHCYCCLYAIVVQEPKAERDDLAAADGTDDTAAISSEELLSKLSTVEKEKIREEEYRNYMQLERDKIASTDGRSLWTALP